MTSTVPEPALYLDAPSRGTLGRLERGKETRRNLVRTAARLWGERGFDAVTVEEICSAAGVGRTTFYLHFESKEHLLSGLAGATGAGVAADLTAARWATTLDEQLEVFIHGVVRRMEAVPKSLAELVIHSQHVQLMKMRVTGDHREGKRFADFLREVLAEARRRGELARSADPGELGECLGALTMDAIEAWASGRSRRKPLEAVLRSRFALIMDPYRVDADG
jgi:AcrR family transcriptional regulator